MYLFTKNNYITGRQNMYKIARLPADHGAKACFVRRNKEKKKGNGRP